MNKMLKSPSKYVQGPDILKEFDHYLQGMGNHFLILISANGVKRSRPILDACFEGKSFTVDYEVFSGECTRKKIQTYASQCKETGVTAVIGFGGGKILDTAKGVSHFSGLPMIIVPTVCSTDSPCSSLSVMYHDDGTFDSYLFLDRCPDMVLVDTKVIAAAPAKLLVAGMGDAMATYFEARACRNSGKNNQLGEKPTNAATEIAALCWNYLKADGYQAKLAAEAHVCTPAFEDIIEVNTYLSSVGFESGGLAAAHGIQKGFTVIPQLHKAYHGNKVALCTLTQLVLENAPQEEIRDVMDFCASVGLPICFADLGYEAVDPEQVRQSAEKACVPNSTIHNLPFDVNADMVFNALIAADAMGTAYHHAHSCV